MATKKESTAEQKGKDQVEVAFTPEMKAGLVQLPVTFVDSMVAMQIGPFVTKLSFGIQNPSTDGKIDFTATLNLAMPTKSVIDLVNNVLKGLVSNEVPAKMRKSYSEVISQLDALSN